MGNGMHRTRTHVAVGAAALLLGWATTVRAQTPSAVTPNDGARLALEQTYDPFTDSTRVSVSGRGLYGTGPWARDTLSLSLSGRVPGRAAGALPATAEFTVVRLAIGPTALHWKAAPPELLLLLDGQTRVRLQPVRWSGDSTDVGVAEAVRYPMPAADIQRFAAARSVRARLGMVEYDVAEDWPAGVRRFVAAFGQSR